MRKILILVAALGLTACGGGSSDSGAGSAESTVQLAAAANDGVTLQAATATPPGGSLIRDVPALITQSGIYQVPYSPSLTDIVVNCPTASVQLTATPTASLIPIIGSQMAACTNGFVRILDHPPYGGTLVVVFNAGDQITVQVVDALSITQGGNR